MRAIKQPTIFLVDMNAFFISCEMTRNPHLRGVPSAVAGDPQKRTGIILAANYEARNFGVRTAMTVNEAMKKCGSLLLVPPDHAFYAEKSREVMAYLSRYSPCIEENSIDEAWLDMTGTEALFGPPFQAARSIMAGLERDVGLWCSIGIADGKFLAKMASDMKKPRGITELRSQDIREKLWPLPIGSMVGIGAKTARRFKENGIHTIGDLAILPQEQVLKKHGRMGLDHHHHAWGRDTTPFVAQTIHNVKSIGKMATLPEDLRSMEEAKRLLLRLSDEVSLRARRKGKKGRTVQIQMKYSDFSLSTRQITVEETNLTKRIHAAGSRLLDQHWNPNRPLRLLGITLTGFQDSSETQQLSLFDRPAAEDSTPDASKDERLENAMDDIRLRFGRDALSWGALLEKDASGDWGKKK